MKSPPTRRKQVRSVLAATSGTVVEYYDLTVYAYLAIIIGPLFFPGDNPTASLLASLAVFASAYLMRPVGGIVIGQIGDKYGRKRALYLSIGLMGIGTLLMALLPTYSTVGVLAPILLVLARLIQGFSAGGEFGGAITYVYEMVGKKRRGLGASFIHLGTNAGFALAATVVGVVSLLASDVQMDSWGWRIPFFFSLPLLIVAIWCRSGIEDSDSFKDLKATDDTAESPIRELLRTHRRQVTQVLGLGIAQSATGYMVLTYMAIYLVREGGHNRTTVVWVTALVITLMACIMPLAGLAIDRFGCRPVLTVGLVWSIVTAIPTFKFMSEPSLAMAGVAFFILALGTPMIQVANSPIFTALFHPRVRLSGVALGFNLSTIAAGGSAAYIATWLVDITGSPTSPAYFIIAACSIGMVALYSIRTVYADLPGFNRANE